MTIDEAIKHCEEQVAKYNRQCEFGISKEGKEYNSQCAADHRQLAEWLRELKDLREENKVLISECDRLIKEKGELLKKSEQIAEYKRLLKSAIDEWHLVCEWGECGEHCEWFENGECAQEWSHKAEALALIGEEGGNDASN